MGQVDIGVRLRNSSVRYVWVTRLPNPYEEIWRRQITIGRHLQFL